MSVVELKPLPVQSRAEIIRLLFRLIKRAKSEGYVSIGVCAVDGAGFTETYYVYGPNGGTLIGAAARLQQSILKDGEGV